MASKRILKELKDLQKDPPTSCSVAFRMPAPKTSVLSYKSPGLPPIPGSLQGYTLTSPKKNTNLRLSSSLKDLSFYNQHDPDGLNPGLERSSSHASPPLLQENGASSFSKEKVPLSSSGRKKWGRLISVLLYLLLFACLCFTMLFLFSNW